MSGARVLVLVLLVMCNGVGEVVSVQLSSKMSVSDLLLSGMLRHLLLLLLSASLVSRVHRCRRRWWRYHIDVAGATVGDAGVDAAVMLLTWQRY